MLEVPDSEAGVRLLRIQDRRHFQRPQIQQPPYCGQNAYHHQQLPSIHPHHVHNPYINHPPPPPRHSRYDESVLLNPNRTMVDREVPSEEYLDRNMYRLHQDLHYHPNQVPYYHNTHFPFPQHQQVPLYPYPYIPLQNPPKLLNPDGKIKKEKKTKNRDKLLLDPFNPTHNIQTDELRKEQKKKQRLFLKRFDSKENSVSENVSIQLLKSSFPQYKEKQILPVYVEEESIEETSTIEMDNKGVQIDLRNKEEKPTVPTIKRSSPPPAKTEKKEEPKECKDHLFDAFRHSGHLHSRIIDLETYFQILEKQEREGNDNSLLDIAILNNTNLFPDKPQMISQMPNFQTDVPMHNVSNIPLFNSNEQRTTKSNDVHIVYEIEDYMPKEQGNSLRKSVTISDKPTVLTYSNTKIQPIQHSIAHMPIESSTTVNPSAYERKEVNEPKNNPQPIVFNTFWKDSLTPQTQQIPTNELKKIFETPPIPPKTEPPTKTDCEIEENESGPPPFEERVIIIEDKKQVPLIEPLQTNKAIPPVYLDKVIYIDDLRKKESPKKPAIFDISPVEIPYYEERIIHVGGEEPQEEAQLMDEDDNISVTTIGSQETYQDYLQRIGIDIDSMPFSSDAIRRKLEMQMAISTRNSLNFSRGSLLFPSDFDDNLMGTLVSTLKDTLKSTVKGTINASENDTEDANQGPSQTETIEKALRNILQNSKIKSKLEKLKEANIDTSLLHRPNIHIPEIEEYKKLSSLVETEYMKNADYLIAQTELLKKETKEAIEKIDTQLGRNVRERFNETIETIYHQRR